MVGFGEKIVPIYLKENVGVAEASNTGIRAALGKFIIRVDSDDYISNHTILFMYEILNDNKDIGFVYANHLKVDAQENVIESVKVDNLVLLLRHGAGIMFRKSYLEALGLYDTRLRNAEDFDLLKRYIKNFNGYHLKFNSYRYRQHDAQMTRDENERKKWEAISDEHRKQDNR
jgi:glycosyltransferase involved in cell wall biosynthesis